MGRLKSMLILSTVMVMSFSGTLLAQSTPVAAIAAPEARQVLGEPKGQPLTGELLSAKDREVSSQLRCPVCQGLSIGDSPSSMAAKMRGEVNDLLAAGYTEGQVLSYFERSYGQLVRLEPSFSGVNWLVWLGPLAVLLFGAFMIWRAMTRNSTSPVPVTPAVATADDPILNSYLDRVRLEAYGPGEPRNE